MSGGLGVGRGAVNQLQQQNAHKIGSKLVPVIPTFKFLKNHINKLTVYIDNN